MRITRSLTIPALALALLAGGTAAGAASNLAPQSVTPSIHLTQASVCGEESACWDCETMGNQICGLPDIQANKAHRTAAWAAWDAAEGWRLMRVDPSVPVKIDVTGYSTTKPRGEFSLRADNGLWYVFATV